VKTSEVLALGALAFLVLRNKNGGSDAPTAQGSWENFTAGSVPTPTGVTPSMIVDAKKLGMDNAEIVNYLSAKTDAQYNALPMSSRSVVVTSGKGKPRTISLPPPSATRTSSNGNQYLAPRSGGGYKTVGARNITLNP